MEFHQGTFTREMIDDYPDSKIIIVLKGSYFVANEIEVEFLSQFKFGTIHVIFNGGQNSEEFFSLALSAMAYVGKMTFHNIKVDNLYFGPMQRILKSFSIELTLSKCTFETCHIEKCERIRSLILTECDFSNFPNNFFERFSKLTSLNLSDNKLKSLPDLSALLDTLVELDVSDNELSKIDYSVLEKFRNLKHLNLANNGLEYESEEDRFHVVGSFKELEYLDLSRNFISNITFEECPNLSRLDLSTNELKYFNIRNLSKLESFILSTNPELSIDEVSDSIWRQVMILGRPTGPNPPIKHLEIDSIATFHRFPDDFKSLQLTSLSARNNDIEDISNIYLPSLLSLDLRDNKTVYTKQVGTNKTAVLSIPEMEKLFLSDVYNLYFENADMLETFHIGKAVGNSGKSGFILFNFDRMPRIENFECADIDDFKSHEIEEILDSEAFDKFKNLFVHGFVFGDYVERLRVVNEIFKPEERTIILQKQETNYIKYSKTKISISVSLSDSERELFNRIHQVKTKPKIQKAFNGYMIEKIKSVIFHIYSEDINIYLEQLYEEIELLIESEEKRTLLTPGDDYPNIVEFTIVLSETEHEILKRMKAIERNTIVNYNRMTNLYHNWLYQNIINALNQRIGEGTEDKFVEFAHEVEILEKRIAEKKEERKKKKKGEETTKEKSSEEKRKEKEEKSKEKEENQKRKEERREEKRKEKEDQEMQKKQKKEEREEKKREREEKLEQRKRIKEGRQKITYEDEDERKEIEKRRKHGALKILGNENKIVILYYAIIHLV